MSEIIGEIQKNSTEKIVISLGEYKGKTRIDMRTYFTTEDDPDEWKPTKKGINLDVKQWEEFKELLEKVDNRLLEKS